MHSRPRFGKPLTDYEQREADRQAALQARVGAIREYQERAHRADVFTSAEEVAEWITEVSAVQVDETFAEFQAEAQQTKDATLYRLDALLTRITDREAEEARQEAERAGSRAPGPRGTGSRDQAPSRRAGPQGSRASGSRRSERIPRPATPSSAAPSRARRRRDSRACSPRSAGQGRARSSRSAATRRASGRSRTRAHRHRASGSSRSRAPGPRSPRGRPRAPGDGESHRGAALVEHAGDRSAGAPRLIAIIEGQDSGRLDCLLSRRCTRHR